MKNFWDRRMMWWWCFRAWALLMREPDVCNREWFWLILNNYNQLFGTNDQFAEDDAFDANVVVVKDAEEEK